jgi:DHA1 family inner membrane transport protein
VGLRSSHSPGRKAEPLIRLALCAAVAIGWAAVQLVPNPESAPALAPDWLPLTAAAVAAAGIKPLDGGSLRWPRIRGAMNWIGLLLMVWTANGLPFDVLTMAGLIGHRTADGAMVMSTVYWPGLATRALALAAAVVLARHALARPAAAEPGHPATWYGYAAFILALPYPVLRVHWALDGTLGLSRSGAAGQGWEPLLLAIPWLLAAALSLLLVSPRRSMPRRLMLAAGWSATVIVAMIGPAAFWSVVSTLASGGDPGSDGIATWVFGLFYGSWLLWAIAAGAATRSYQLRTASVQEPLSLAHGGKAAESSPRSAVS